MKKITALIVALAANVAVMAQNDSTAFRAYLYNKEYDVFLNINLYGQDITVPGQELYGRLPGYLSKKRNPFCWLITSARIVSQSEAELEFINDYGSEDLTARLTCQNDSIYTLRQLKGSTLKVPKNGKWQKLPKTLELKRRK